MRALGSARQTEQPEARARAEHGGPALRGEVGRLLRARLLATAQDGASYPPLRRSAGAPERRSAGGNSGGFISPDPPAAEYACRCT
eukprot:3446151-Prymnesium_polylepis.2